MTETIINLETVNPIEFFGVNNNKFDILKKKFPLLKILSRGTQIKLSGAPEQIDLAKEKIDLIQSASAQLIVELLPVMDDYERALANAPKGEISEGTQLIFNRLNSILLAKGVKELPAKGEIFDADLHDCITQFPAPTEEEKGKVVEVIEKGYTLNEKVIRFAKVVVGN